MQGAIAKRSGITTMLAARWVSYTVYEHRNLLSVVFRGFYNDVCGLVQESPRFPGQVAGPARTGRVCGRGDGRANVITSNAGLFSCRYVRVPE